MSETGRATIAVLAGFVMLIGGGELLVRGASALAAALRVSPLIIGLTVVAFGTSAPELAVGVQSAFAGETDLAVGNVVGSNIANVLLILGLSALVAPLIVSSQLVRIEVPLVIVVSVLMLLLGLDGTIGRMDGCLLFGGLLLYLGWSIRQSRRERREIAQEYAAAQTPLTKANPRTLAVNLLLIGGGLILLAFGSDWLVEGASTIADKLGVSELVIGLTVVAIGTSLPEVVTSVMASLRGQRDIAVGNIVGSNLFNILCVLGLSAIVAPVGINVLPKALRFDIPVMIAVAVACLPIFFTGHLIARWEGGLFLSYYAAYMAYLVLSEIDSDATPTFAVVMSVFVIPLTVVTLLVTSYRAVRAQGRI